MTQCLSVSSIAATIKGDFPDVKNSTPNEDPKLDRPLRSKDTSLNFRLPVQPAFKKPWTPPSKGVLVPRKTKGIPRCKNIAETILMKLATNSQRKRGKVNKDQSSDQSKKLQWSQCPAVCDTWDLAKWTQQDLGQHVSRLNTHKISPLHRCKWIISADNTGNPERRAAVWTELCDMISSGAFPHCNACLRENQDVWVYCDSNNAIKVHDTLQETFKLSKKLTFHIVGMNITVKR